MGGGASVCVCGVRVGVCVCGRGAVRGTLTYIHLVLD